MAIAKKGKTHKKGTVHTRKEQSAEFKCTNCGDVYTVKYNSNAKNREIELRILKGGGWFAFDDGYIKHCLCSKCKRI